ncbi:MAG: helix-turn-helix domain-containing protein, partial [Actinobacteria bacterium]|nr:helix-turn-helix domain-containing protein [Actinomycetota bacterium]
MDLEGIDVSLDHLLSNLGPGAIQLLVAPKGLAVTVGDPVIVDPMDTTSGIERDAIVLAIGISPDSSLARTLISTAGRVGATAVAFKLMGRQCEWLPEAEKAGVALLTVADEMSWTHLYRLLALTLPSLRQSAPVAGMASVPLGDLFALANAVGALVGGAVTIEDKSARVLAYSTLPGQPIDEARQQTILGREVPDTAEMKALYQRLSQTEGVIRIEEIPDLSLKMWPRIAAPVRVGKETLGSIWALEGDSPLGRDAERALIEAARVAALHLIHARSSRDVERRTRGDLLRSLLEGRGDVNSTLTRLGLERRSPLVVMAFELSGADPTEEDLYRERVVDLVATYSEAYRLKGACVAIGRTVYGLLPVSKSMAGERILGIARDIHSHAQSAIGIAVNVGVSSVVGDLMQVPSACHEAERVLRVLASRGGELQVASIDDVRSHVTLLALQDIATENPDLLKGSVQELAEHDEQKNTAYLETLRAYLDAFGDIPTAAASVNVHPNTFRYRLRRLLELFSLDISDPDQRLVIELQLRLIQG